MSTRCCSIAFGGPERARGHPAVSPHRDGGAAPSRAERLEEVAHHYELIGGRSPLGDLTRRQARGFAARSRARASRGPSTSGCGTGIRSCTRRSPRCGTPAIAARLGIILSSLQTEASWDRYVADVAAAREKVGAGAPEVVFAQPWADHPLFIEAMVDRAAAALARVPGARAGARRIWSSPRTACRRRWPTARPTRRSSRRPRKRIAERLGQPRWSIAYQSRSGSPRDPWLEPDIGDVLRDLARGGRGGRGRRAHRLRLSTTSRCSTTSTSRRARSRPTSASASIARAAANDHPAFIAMLVDLRQAERRRRPPAS